MEFLKQNAPDVDTHESRISDWSDEDLPYERPQSESKAVQPEMEPRAISGMPSRDNTHMRQTKGGGFNENDDMLSNLVRDADPEAHDLLFGRTKHRPPLIPFSELRSNPEEYSEYLAMYNNARPNVKQMMNHLGLKPQLKQHLKRTNRIFSSDAARVDFYTKFSAAAYMAENDIEQSTNVTKDKITSKFPPDVVEKVRIAYELMLDPQEAAIKNKIHQRDVQYLYSQGYRLGWRQGRLRELAERRLEASIMLQKIDKEEEQANLTPKEKGALDNFYSERSYLIKKTLDRVGEGLDHVSNLLPKTRKMSEIKDYASALKAFHDIATWEKQENNTNIQNNFNLPQVSVVMPEAQEMPIEKYSVVSYDKDGNRVVQEIEAVDITGENPRAFMGYDPSDEIDEVSEEAQYDNEEGDIDGS